MTDLTTTTETLLADHTHAGTEYHAGDSIEVTAPERAWLIEQGKIADAAIAKPAGKKSTAE